ncbi:MAG: M20/M25/M40 family metallo-hydrolase, partial [Gemmatimonadota bacterium]|nr:M20/M25/M40 family metallo-hydrolase [Gemmatimonadota bacterium]
MTTQPREYIADHQSRFQADFFELLRIPSISTDPEHAGSVRAAAEWLRGRMAAAGLRASVEETEGHPLVLGRYDAGPEAPTLLVYAHYDVQPPDPLDAWSSPPFEPTVRDGMVVARGAADDKAQAIIQMGAAEAALATGGLPVNLILLFEGEEEVGSPSLVPYLREHADHLRADHVIIGDSMMFAPGRPSLIFGMRGLAYFEVEIRTGGWDLHSGQYGGAVPNPAHVLAEVIASFHDREGRVAVAGFYDAVAEVPDAWREGWRHLGFDDEAYRRTAGGAPLFGEPGYATHERLWIRPA